MLDTRLLCHGVAGKRSLKPIMLRLWLCHDKRRSLVDAGLNKEHIVLIYSIKYPVSRIEHPESSIEYPASSIKASQDGIEIFYHKKRKIFK